MGEREGNRDQQTEDETSGDARNELESFVKNMISPFFYETHRQGEHIRPLTTAHSIFDNIPLQHSMGALVRFTNNLEDEETKLAGFSSREELLNTSLEWIADVWAFEISQNPRKKHSKYGTPADRMVAREIYQIHTEHLLKSMAEIYISLSKETGITQPPDGASEDL